MTPEELETHLDSFKSRTVLLVGDTILDRNVYCRVRGMSAETPTVVLEEKEVAESQGGAACVQRNLEALGTTVKFITQTRAEKTRYWVDDHKMLQVDRFMGPMPELAWAQHARLFNAYLGLCDTVVVADYRHGLIDENLAAHMVRVVDKPFYVSSQVSNEESNHLWYGSTKTRFVMNLKEADTADLNIANYETVVTRGSDGAYRCFGSDTAQAITATAIDTCGSGDAFLAAYSLTNSLEFANLWAGLSTEVRGANPPTIEAARKWVSDHQ